MTIDSFLEDLDDDIQCLKDRQMALPLDDITRHELSLVIWRLADLKLLVKERILQRY